jgi:hypothetical protein
MARHSTLSNARASLFCRDGFPPRHSNSVATTPASSQINVITRRYSFRTSFQYFDF